MMAMTAAIADTAEAMELIAAQMLSIGFLLSDYDYYNNKLVKVFKAGHAAHFQPEKHCPMPPLQGLPSDTQDALLTYGTHSPGGLPLQRCLVPPTWPSSRPADVRCRREASRLKRLPAGSLSLSFPCGLRPCLATPQSQLWTRARQDPSCAYLAGVSPCSLAHSAHTGADLAGASGLCLTGLPQNTQWSPSCFR